MTDTERIAALRAALEEAHSRLLDVVVEVKRERLDLLAQVERLTALVKSAERKGRDWEGDPCCPWCEGYMGQKINAHTEGCPAFTPKGALKEVSP